MYNITINTYPYLNMQDKEFAEIVKGEEKIMETALSFMSRANTRIDAINEIEKGELPEIIEIIRNRNEALQGAFNLIEFAEREILVLFSAVNAFIRQFIIGASERVIRAANSRNLTVTILTPINNTVKKMAEDLENQSTNMQIRRIAPSSRSTITVLIVDKKFSLAVELKDDSRTVIEEAIGTSTYSTGKSTVLSYVSMFESFLRLTESYDESQSKLNDTTDELEVMKKYLNEVLEEIDKFRKTS